MTSILKHNKRADIQPFWLLFTLCMGAFLSHFNAGVVNVSLPHLTSVFQTNLYSVQWITTAYLLIITALLPTMGKLGDRFGHGQIHNLGYAIFTAGSVLIVFSPNVYVLIVFRVVQAIGAAMFQATNIGLISFYYPKQHRGRALGILSSIVALGAMMGPLAGGFIAQWLSWHWLFLIHLPVAATAILLAWRYIPAKRMASNSTSINRSSSLLFFVIIASGIYALSSGNSQGWLSISVLSAMIVGCIALSLFLIREARQQAPFLPLAVLSIPSVASGLLISCISFILINTMLTIMPIYLSQMTSYSPSSVGMIITAYPVAFALSSLVAGYLSDAIHPKWLMLIGLCCMLASTLMLSVFLSNLTGISLVPVLSLMGLGMGCLTAPNNSYIMREVPTQYIGSIGGMIALTRNIGMTLGAALGLGMISSQLDNKLSLLDFEIVFGMNVILCVVCFAALAIPLYLKRHKNIQA